MILVNGGNLWEMLSNDINGNEKQGERRRWSGSDESCCGRSEAYPNTKEMYAVGCRT